MPSRQPLIRGVIGAGATVAGAVLRDQLRLLPDLSNALSRHYFNLTDDAPHRVHTRIEPKP